MKSMHPEQSYGPSGVPGVDEAEAEGEFTRKAGSGEEQEGREETVSTEKAARILTNVLKREGDEAALEDARRNIDAIEHYLKTLDHEKPNFLDQIVTDTMNPEWFALVLEVLGRSSPVIDLEGLEPLLRSVEEDERSIGYAMRDVFLAGLPDILLDFESWYASVELIDRSKRKQRDVLEWLEERPSMEAFKEADGRFGCWEPLLRRGITPITILRGAEAVAGIIDPVLRPAHAMERLAFSISDDYTRMELASGDIEEIAGEVGLMCECTPVTAHLILRWLAAASIYKPYLFDGCTAVIDRVDAEAMVHVDIVYTGAEVPDLYTRWRTVYDEIR